MAANHQQSLLPVEKGATVKADGLRGTWKVLGQAASADEHDPSWELERVPRGERRCRRQSSLTVVKPASTAAKTKKQGR